MRQGWIMECKCCKKTIRKGTLCQRCRKKFPKGCIITDVNDFQTVLSYKCPFRFHAGEKIGVLQFDLKQFLLKINRHIYEVRYLKDYSLSVEKQDKTSIILFFAAFLYPEMRMQVPAVYCTPENEELVIQQIHQIMQDMITGYIKERDKTFLPQARRLLDETDPVVPKKYLEKARNVFYLPEKYTLSQLRHQRNLLLKYFHPDSGGKTSDTQKITAYYQALLTGIDSE